MKKSKIIHTFLLYASTALFFRGITMLLNPLYMRMFSPDQYGALSLIESFVYICTTLTGVGLRKLLALECIHHTPEKQKKLINDIMVTHLLLALPVLSLLFIFRNQILRILFSNSIGGSTFMFVIIVTLCSFFCELLYQIMRFRNYARALSLIHIFNASSIACLTLCGLYLLGWGIMAIPAAQGITMTIIATIGFWGWKKNGYTQQLNIQKAVRAAPTYLYQSLPLTLNVLLLWMLESGDRWMLARWATMHDVGIYSAAYLCNSLMYALVVMPWTGAYVPALLQHYARNKAIVPLLEQRNQKYMWYSMGLLFMLVLIGFFIFSWPLRIILPPTYHKALPLILPIMISRIIYFGAQWNLCVLQFYKKVLLLNGITIIPLIISGIGNALLIPRYGALAPCLVSLVSLTLYFGLSWGCNRMLIKRENAHLTTHTLQ